MYSANDLPNFHGYHLLCIPIPDEFVVDQTDGQMKFNFRFGELLKCLERKASQNQFQFAVISTLGGAYHLCNKPKVALLLAQKQERLGRRMESTIIVVKSKMFQAANWRALDDKEMSDKCVEDGKALIGACGDYKVARDMERFVAGFEDWLNKNFKVAES